MVSEQLKHEIANGEGQKLTDLAKIVPSARRGKPATLSRLIRWIFEGIKGPLGDRVQLEAIRGPDGWVSTPAALTRFFESLTPKDADNRLKNNLASRTAIKQQSASSKAAAELGKKGI